LVDWLSIVYGALVTVGAYILARVVDLVLKRIFNASLFAKLWESIVKSIKTFSTRWHPIKMQFHFRVMLKPSEPEKTRDLIANIIANLSGKYKGQVVFSPLLWSSDRTECSLNALYNNTEYTVNLSLSSEYRDGETESEPVEVMEVSDSITISIEASFPFRSLETTLFNLNSIIDLMDEQLKHSSFWKKSSNGLITLAPTKADFTIADWVKEKKFAVSVNLKAKENIIINLYPSKAEIALPSLLIDGKIYEYLKATILEYYL
jgi:hypothetical protein